MAKSNRSPEPALPRGKAPIMTAKTPVTGQGGRLGTKMATLGPTPVGIHGPLGVHSHIVKNTNPRPVTPNPHAAELHTPGVSLKNSPTKKGQ